jgi:hypothetical protein
MELIRARYAAWRGSSAQLAALLGKETVSTPTAMVMSSVNLNKLGVYPGGSECIETEKHIWVLVLCGDDNIILDACIIDRNNNGFMLII